MKAGMAQHELHAVIFLWSVLLFDSASWFASRVEVRYEDRNSTTRASCSHNSCVLLFYSAGCFASRVEEGGSVRQHKLRAGRSPFLFFISLDLSHGSY